MNRPSHTPIRNSTRLPSLGWVERDCSGTGPLKLLLCFSVTVGFGFLVLAFAVLLHVTQETLMIVLILIPACAELIESLFVNPFMRKFCGNGSVRMHNQLIETIKDFTITLTTTTVSAEIKPPRPNLA